MTATRTHILRAAVAGAVLGAGLLMTGCSSAPDPAATTACTLLAEADNGMNTAVYQYLNDEPGGGVDAVRAASTRRGSLATKAFNAAPASLATVFSAAKREANLAALDQHDVYGLAAKTATRTALTACVHAGVPVQTVDQGTGQTGQLTG